jgi:hypothetical protein
VIHRRGTTEWWMFYTARRATLTTGGEDWITGTRIGIAVSTEAGASWQYRGVVEGLDPEGAPGLNTHRAPEVVWHNGSYHMFLTSGRCSRHVGGTDRTAPGALHQRRLGAL